MDELNAQFNNYIETFKQLDTNSKKEEFIRILKEFVAMLNVVATNEGVETHFLKSGEILDLNQEFVPEDDFIEAALVYLENAKNIIGELLDKKLYSDIEM